MLLQLAENHSIFVLMRSKPISYLYLVTIALLLVCSVLQFHHHDADGSVHMLDGCLSKCVAHSSAEEGNSNSDCHSCGDCTPNHHTGEHHCHCCCTLQLSFMDKVQCSTLEHLDDEGNDLYFDFSSLVYAESEKNCVSSKPTTSVSADELPGWGAIRLLRAPPMHC